MLLVPITIGLFGRTACSGLLPEAGLASPDEVLVSPQPGEVQRQLHRHIQQSADDLGFADGPTAVMPRFPAALVQPVEMPLLQEHRRLPGRGVVLPTSRGGGTGPLISCREEYALAFGHRCSLTHRQSPSPARESPAPPPS